MIMPDDFIFKGEPSLTCYGSELISAVRLLVATHDVPCPDFEQTRRIRDRIPDEKLPITMGVLDMLEGGTPLPDVLNIREEVAHKVDDLLNDDNADTSRKVMAIVDMISSEQELCRWWAALN